MAIRIYCEDENVTGEVRLEVNVSSVTIGDVYWVDEKGKKIDKLIPQSKAYLYIETEVHAGAKNKDIVVTLKQKSGKPFDIYKEKPKPEDYERKKKVKAKDNNHIKIEYEWDVEDTVVATVKGKNEVESTDLIKEWGIWIDGGNKSDMHYFQAQRGYLESNLFIKDFYEAYLYLSNVSVAKDLFNRLNDRKTDLYIKNDRGEFIPNNSYVCDFINKQLLGIVYWQSRVGVEFENEEKNRVRVSPSIILIHELGHALDCKEMGAKGYVDLYSDSIGKEFGNIKKFDNLVEYSTVMKYEIPVAKALGQGIRPKYKEIKAVSFNAKGTNSLD